MNKNAIDYLYIVFHLVCRRGHPYLVTEVGFLCNLNCFLHEQCLLGSVL